MTVIQEILDFNKDFVKNKEYEKYITTKYPNKKLAILSCMDTRLTELLPAALNIKNGDIKIIKNAGAVVTHPFGSVMRSLLVAVYELGVEMILVIGHDDCGMQNLNTEKLMDKMIKRKISKKKIEVVEACGIDVAKWFEGFKDVKKSVRSTVNMIKEHPLMPKDVSVFGFLICPETGKLIEIKK